MATCLPRRARSTPRANSAAHHFHDCHAARHRGATRPSPLPCQAFNIVISLFHNPTTAGLDALPAAEARESPSAPAAPAPSGGGGTAGGSASSPTRSPLSGVGIDLSAAKAGSIINTASLEGLSHAVYTMTVQGAKVYSGLYNGNIQVGHVTHPHAPRHTSTSACATSHIHAASA